MPRRLALKLSLSLTIIVVVIASVSGYISQRAQQRQLLRTMILGADQLSKSITSATWHSMLADDRGAAYQIMRTIAEKQGVDRIRMFNREGRLTFSTDAAESRAGAVPVSGYCRSCHKQPPIVSAPIDLSDRVRVESGLEEHRSVNVITTIYNERSCSEADCHAHPANLRVLGILDVALGLDVLDQQAAAVKANVAITTLIEILLAAVMIVLLTRRFLTIPIQDLIAGTKAVAKMDLDTPISIRYKSQELEDLEDSFNIMRERLRAALAELNEFTNRLEARVAERTAQLNAAQKKLLHTDRLASLGQLAASVAHEINNPVSGVLNLSMLLERIMKNGQVPPGREEECKKYLARISTETGRVGRIVSDLLSFSRRSKPQRSAAELNKLINTTISLVSHKMKLDDTRLELDLALNLPAVQCDSSQIQQVILNLVLNAAEATQTKEGGKVRVRTRLSEDGKSAEMVVQDNGEGIAPENVSKIFDPFFTTKAEGKGVGLGLAVVYGIIQSHDGDIDVKSTLRQGTTFTVSLPIMIAPGSVAAVPEVIPVGQGS